MKVPLLICSDSAAIDSRTSSISLFHVFEEIDAASFPFVIPRVCVSIVTERSAEEPSVIDLELRVSLGERTLHGSRLNVPFQERLKNRFVFAMFGIVVPVPGDLVFELRNGEESVSAWTIKVKHVGNVGSHMFPQLAPPPKSDQPVAN